MQQVKNILLIDDDVVFNLINEKFIERSKLTLHVSSFTDTSKALAHLRKIIKTNTNLFPEIIFIDMHISGMDIWTFLKELNKLPQYILDECKVFALTATVFDEDIEKSKAYKMLSSFILKPLTMDKLEALFPGKNDYAQYN